MLPKRLLGDLCGIVWHCHSDVATSAPGDVLTLFEPHIHALASL